MHCFRIDWFQHLKNIYPFLSSLRLPGSKTKLLEQKIPATYLALEDVVGGIASELRSGGNDPVLNQVKIDHLHFCILLDNSQIYWSHLILIKTFDFAYLGTVWNGSKPRIGSQVQRNAIERYNRIKSSH